jgi:PhnB protein
MAKSVKPVPQGFHTVTPNLVCRDAARAVEFYKKVFDAAEGERMTTPDGKVAHTELKIGDSIIFVNDSLMQPLPPPEKAVSNLVSLYVYVDDVDKVFDRAVAAGSRVDMPVQDMFWGDRYGRLTDPFGQQWGIATHIEEVAPEEVRRRAQAMFAKMAAGKQ